FTFVRAEYIPIILDKNDEVIAFGITLPSLSKAMQKTGGKLFPFGFFHLLKAMKKNDRVDFYLIAVKPEYQNKGVNALLFTDLIPKYAQDGIQWAETNVELIDNEKVRKQWDYFEKRIHKRRSAFIKYL
ncbi:MAG: N-acetyltransferase, partial [Bacteroidetes bacterium HGW-Bacteroidetes-22]